jgi:ABC-type branched-subunit amino acid transport system substrate-binding protein
MKEKKWLLSVVIVLLGYFVMAPLPYCSAANPPGFDDKEIKIASWGPQTGPAAPWGSIARGPALLFALVNEEGGIHGRKIKHILRDDQYNPARTKLLAKELVEKIGVLAVTSGLGSSCTLAVRDYLAENKIVAVGMCTAAMELVKPTGKYYFSSFDLFGDEMSVLTKYAVEELKFKKIGFFYQNDPMGLDALNGARERMKTYGMEFVAEIPVEPTEKDLSSQILKFKNAGAECVMMQVAPTPGVVAVKTAAAIGYKPQWISADTLGDMHMMYKITGGLWEGVITGGKTLSPDGDDPLIVKYREAAKRLMPEEQFSGFFLAGIMFAEPLVYALKKVGRDLSTEALVNALNSVKDFQGVGPKITWTPDQHQGVDSTRIYKCGPNGSYILLQDWTANELTGWKQ